MSFVRTWLLELDQKTNLISSIKEVSIQFRSITIKI